MGTRRILHVEDDPDIRTITEIALATVGGYDLKQCADGQEAVEMARDFKPDLLLLDSMMPGMSGAETLEALREFDHIRSVPAIFMTAKAQPEEIEAHLNLGAIAVITKPFDPMKLGAEIEDVLEKATAR